MVSIYNISFVCSISFIRYISKSFFSLFNLLIINLNNNLLIPGRKRKNKEKKEKREKREKERKEKNEKKTSGLLEEIDTGSPNLWALESNFAFSSFPVEFFSLFPFSVFVCSTF